MDDELQRDDTELRHRRLGAEQELARARTDLERASSSALADPEVCEHLEEIERELAAAQQSKALLFRARRRRHLLALLLSERLVLRRLGFDSYTEYLTWRDEGGALGVEDDPAYVEFALLEFEVAEQRLSAIERGEIHLDRLEGGRRELTPIAWLKVQQPAGDPQLAPGEVGPPLAAWHNPFEPGPPTHRDRPADLPQVGPDGTDATDLPYWSESA